VANVVVGVIGGSGGAGASTLAAALAAAAGPCTLIDCDAAGGGIDVLLGIEGVPGARWSGLRVGGGHLEPQLLREGLPRWAAVSVLAADCAPSPDAVAQVVHAAGSLGAVVLDLPRAPCELREVAVPLCSMAVLLAVAAVRPLAAARAVRPAGGAVGVVIRRGAVAPVEAARMLGAPLLGVLPGVPAAAPPRSFSRVAGGVLDGCNDRIAEAAR
jgi:hypothetical protein